MLVKVRLRLRHREQPSEGEEVEREREWWHRIGARREAVSLRDLPSGGHGGACLRVVRRQQQGIGMCRLVSELVS